MKIKNQVTSLKLSKKLKGLGVEQDNLWCWLQCEELNEFILTLKKDADKLRQADGVRGDNGKLHEIYSAFSVAELGEKLGKYGVPTKSDTGRWVVIVNGNFIVTCQAEAEARGLMYEYLLKNKLI